MKVTFLQYPFTIIESKIDKRDEFEVKEGKQPTHALFYLKSGKFEMEIDGIKEMIHQGDIVIFPNYIHFKRRVKKSLSFIYIKFSAIDDYKYILPIGKIDIKNNVLLQNSLARLEELLEEQDKFSYLYRNTLLCNILLSMIWDKRSLITFEKTSVSKDPLLSKAEHYILTNINKKILISNICSYCATNSSTLNYKFRHITGMSIGAYISDVRMKLARKLLSTTSYSITDTAKRCGFEDVYYFSNFFKKFHGTSPTEYRKQNL